MTGWGKPHPQRRTSMKIKEITIFTRNGLETLDRKTFIENLDLGIYDGDKLEIVETKR